VQEVLNKKLNLMVSEVTYPACPTVMNTQGTQLLVYELTFRLWAQVVNQVPVVSLFLRKKSHLTSILSWEFKQGDTVSFKAVGVNEFQSTYAKIDGV